MFRSCVRLCARRRTSEGTPGFEPPRDSDVAPGGWGPPRGDGWSSSSSSSSSSMPATAAAAAAAGEGARALCSYARAASRVLAGCMCARACGDRNLSPAQQPQRMPFSNRPKQLSNVLDPA
eukprot:2106505-Prymnesium_polylepis.1